MAPFRAERFFITNKFREPPSTWDTHCNGRDPYTHPNSHTAHLHLDRPRALYPVQWCASWRPVAHPSLNQWLPWFWSHAVSLPGAEHSRRKAPQRCVWSVQSMITAITEIRHIYDVNDDALAPLFRHGDRTNPTWAAVAQQHSRAHSWPPRIRPRPPPSPRAVLLADQQQFLAPPPPPGRKTKRYAVQRRTA